MNYDLDFLKLVDDKKIRVIYGRITILDFNTEEVIQSIEGKITGGNVSVSSSSRIRRSMSLQMIAKPEYIDIENVDNLISINRKVKIEVGIGDRTIYWFKQGIFVVTSASVTKGVSGWRIDIGGKDKMVFLNGTCGGTLPSATRLDLKYEEDENGVQTGYKVPIHQIIRESVNHFGGELLNNIFINDLPEYGEWILKYMGSSPIYFALDYSTLTTSIAEASTWGPGGSIEKTKGDDVGYEEVELTYPGELIMKAGDSVVTILDKIVEMLGNYEYFYNVDGEFIFQQIKNYLNTASPLNELEVEDYLASYSNKSYEYSMKDQNDVIQITKAPNYENIKNDFIVWGTRNLANGIEQNICYRLVVDDKPKIAMAGEYWWKREVDGVIQYDYTDSNLHDGEWELIGKPCTEWREEMFRQAAAASLVGAKYSEYDAELLQFWRDAFDTTKEGWENGWNPEISTNPSSLVYWLDFLDSNAAIGRYSVSTIGRRTIVENNNKVQSIYYRDLPDVIFTSDETAIQRYILSGQQYFKTNDKYDSLFVRSSTGVSAFDRVRELLYQHLVYNTTIQVTCVPKYYLEVNTVMYIEDKDLMINGNYTINSFSVPLTYNGTMSIQLSEVLTRV